MVAGETGSVSAAAHSAACLHLPGLAAYKTSGAHPRIQAFGRLGARFFEEVGEPGAASFLNEQVSRAQPKKNINFQSAKEGRPLQLNWRLEDPQKETWGKDQKEMKKTVPCSKQKFSWDSGVGVNYSIASTPAQDVRAMWPGLSSRHPKIGKTYTCARPFPDISRQVNFENIQINVTP